MYFLYNSCSIVGMNCHFDPFVSIECVRKMKAGLDAVGLHPYLFIQPLAYYTPDAGRQGFIDLPEFPFALEPRVATRFTFPTLLNLLSPTHCTRWDMHKYAREAFDLGVRYIGGCCGFEAYHIRWVLDHLV